MARSLGVMASEANRLCVEPKVCRFSGTALGVMPAALEYSPGPGRIWRQRGAVVSSAGEAGREPTRGRSDARGELHVEGLGKPNGQKGWVGRGSGVLHVGDLGGERGRTGAAS